MSHDPKLKIAMAEIFGILQKHDIGAAITLVSTTHAEFRFREDPSWSCAKIEDSNTVRFRARRADFKTAEQQFETIELTVHLLAQVRDIAANTFGAFDEMFRRLDKILKIEHQSFSGFERHNEQ